MSWDFEFREKLLNTNDYRQFLKLFFAKKAPWSTPKALTFGQFTQRSGLASRGYLPDIIAGRKNLSPASFEKVAAGLSLPPDWAEYLKCLVAVEENSFITPKLDSSFYKKRLKTLRQKLSRMIPTQTKFEPSTLPEAFLAPHFPEIYSALGKVEVGASVNQIMNRTRLPKPTVMTLLKKMVSEGIIGKSETGDVFYPLQETLNFEGLASATYFKSDFFRAIETSKSRFDSQSDSENSLFMTQTFSVSYDRLPEFRSRLLDFIVSFADESENEEGDTVSEICISFTNCLD